jgi:hypothetical protein
MSKPLVSAHLLKRPRPLVAVCALRAGTRPGEECDTCGVRPFCMRYAEAANVGRDQRLLRTINAARRVH